MNFRKIFFVLMWFCAVVVWLYIVIYEYEAVRMYLALAFIWIATFGIKIYDSQKHV